ncbi:hypothetical protein [Roseinatronobacter alkalisoli]|uniref:Uncharacterized protein n=1 Tax=Roseinatronobacter alkalisoli TaxID=3028235 RepID=A0ABT5TCR5_9RHOB|nr:hypothetical protein [Roseinatronobacter sp. HJB301]MDD7972915.1 hypothetical protein [Roseinatronobacter sp. HJB301]
MERHFASLAERRATSGFPLFALEHGLDEGELEEIGKQLRARLNTGLRLAPHWLLWTIYAAERGYTYEGGEYWQSFEDVTPGWDSRDRYRVTAWFSKFQSTYNGVVPSGPWASHFSIIAWPITHAVLPRYLQQQFARTLYDLRFMLARLTTIEPAVIGRLIANNVYHASTRFEQFLQQEELVGRIVLALLHQDLREGEEPLLPATLDRIVADLEQMRHARSWLREASRVVADRFKGIGRGAAPTSSGEVQASAERQLQEARPDIRPDLRLRYVGDGRWTLVIDVPNFKAIAAVNPDIRQFLRQSRSKLNGDDVRRPAGWVLSGNRRAVLKAWPDPSRPLVSFESPNGVVDHLLESECRMSPGPIWLFRIGGDGTAREIVSRLMRPGYAYILASPDEFEDLQEGMTGCAIDCSDICAVRVSVPSDVSDDYMQWLRRRNLELARTIRVWPAGLPGRNWDGEGRSEWLTSESPCFGIVPDHPVDSYIVTLDDGAAMAFQAGEPGEPTFIQLPQLAAGTHRLNVKARRSAALDGLGGVPTHEGYLELRVREPEPWIPGTNSHVGLVVTSNPHDAALDVFWENELDLTVFGPEGRQVIPHVSLEDAKGEEIYSAQVCPPMDLPIFPETWKKRFLEYLRRENAEWRYLEAASGLLTIEGQELGRFDVRFDHDALPVRWVLRHRGEAVSLRLVDDTGQEGAEPKCRFFSMETPTRIERLDAGSALSGFDVQSPGGLFITQNGKFRDLVIVSTGLSGSGLEGLGVQPVYDSIADSPKSIIKHMRILRYWRTARLAGFLANARRAQVVIGLTTRLHGALAGRDWGRAEAAFMRSNDRENGFDHLQSLLDHRGGFPAVLRRDAVSIEGGRKAIASWYAELAARYGVCSDQALCTLAVDIASRPHEVPRLYRDRLPALLKRIMAKPLLLRGARIVALSHACADNGPAELLPRWE